MEEKTIKEHNNDENTFPRIQTRNLRKYRTIYPPRPPPPPTKREFRDAQRCRRSGMVPGAIRKYLLQKKKHEDDVIEEDEDVTGSPPPLPSNNGEENFENAVGVVEDETVEVENEDESANGLIEQEDLPRPQQHVLLEVDYNQDLGAEEAEEGSSGSSDEPEVYYVHTPSPIRENNDSSANNTPKSKRTFSEAFSPDTTTPATPLESSSIPAVATPTIEIEIESSPLDESPEKRMKVDDATTPPSTPKKKGKKPPSANPSQNARTGPVRKSKVVAASVSASGPSSSSSSGSSPPVPWVRNLQPPTFTQDSEDPAVDKLVKKNQWGKIIDRFERGLQDKRIPIPRHVGDLIKKAILGVGTRVSKEVPEMALKFFALLVKEYPIGCHREPMEYYAAAFTTNSGERESCKMSEFLIMVLDTIEADARAKVHSMALPYFKILTKMVVRQYKDYETSPVRVIRPFFVQFLEEDDIVSYNFYCKKLVQYVFLFKDFEEELKMVMRWVGLLSYHLVNVRRENYEFQRLVNDFVENVTKHEFNSELVQGIADPSLGAAVCMRLLYKKIMFEAVNGDLTDLSDEEIAAYFEALAETDLITGLQSSVKERHSSSDSPIVSPLINSGKKAVATNLKGESFLHKLCRKVNTDASDSKGKGLELEKLLRQREYSVNPTDNFGNTPLHDAIAHGRLDAVIKFYENCSDLSLPEALRINVLAQTTEGDTPFHLAAVSDRSENMVPILLAMAENLQVKEEALKTLNHQGKMPYELAFNATARALLKPQRVTEWVFEHGNARVHPISRTQLQSLDTRKLVLFWSGFVKLEKRS